MKKTPNGRTYPRAKDIYINYENSDQRRRDAAIRHDENTKRTLKEFTSRPDIQEKQKNAKDTKALTEKRYQELKPMISNMKSSLFNEIIEFTKTHSVDEAIRHFSAKIKEYKTLHDEYDEIVKKLQSHYSSDYSDLFIDLSQANPEFLLYAPVQIFTTKNNLRISALNDEQLAILQKKLEQNSINANENFKKNYIKYFPDFFSNMFNINDMFYAMTKRPELYVQFRNTGAYATDMNEKNLKTLITIAPATMLYMNREEIYKIANLVPAKIGLAISKCPEIMEILDNKFFADFPPKQIFGTSTVPKQTFLVKIKKYLPEFPEVEKYLTNHYYNTPISTKEDYNTDGGFNI